jgi:hypothetical protein
MDNEDKLNDAYFKWKWCMLNYTYMGINLISADKKCHKLYKSYVKAQNKNWSITTNSL